MFRLCLLLVLKPAVGGLVSTRHPIYLKCLLLEKTDNIFHGFINLHITQRQSQKMILTDMLPAILHLGECVLALNTTEHSQLLWNRIGNMLMSSFPCLF